MKKVLLIGGGGTLGRYTSAELLRLGNCVDVICLEDIESDDERLTYYKGRADLEYLTEFLKDKYYDAIVNFIHYEDVEVYKPVHMLLSANTKQLVFLSSYRIYSSNELPIVETSPTLYDTVDDPECFENETYSVPKTKAEMFIRNESGTKNWTIVRPVISFSDRRLDIVTVSGRKVVDCAKDGTAVMLPKDAKNLTAALDWAGNSGKLIANLLFKDDAIGEAFTISTAQAYTWGEIADMYTEILGVKFDWVDTETYLENDSFIREHLSILKYDRFLDRKIDNSKVLKVTGLKCEDFIPIKDGIKKELDKILK